MNLRGKQLAGGLAAAALGASIAAWAQSGARSDGGRAVSAPDRAAIEAVVRDYILAHPEILPQAMERLQARQTASAVAANRAAIETPFAGAWAGNPKGDVTLVEYFDYACGYCRASVADIDRLIAADRNLKVVFRELPILSEASAQAARLSLLAAQQGKFYAFHKAVYAGGQPSAAKLAAAAAQAGLGASGATPAAPAIDREIATNVDMARTLKLSGTPSFVVGDAVLNGAVGYDALRQAIADARAKKG